MSLEWGIAIAGCVFTLAMWLRDRYWRNRIARDALLYAALISMLAEVEMRKEQARRDARKP